MLCWFQPNMGLVSWSDPRTCHIRNMFNSSHLIVRYDGLINKNKVGVIIKIIMTISPGIITHFWYEKVIIIDFRGAYNVKKKWLPQFEKALCTSHYFKSMDGDVELWMEEWLLLLITFNQIRSNQKVIVESRSMPLKSRCVRVLTNYELLPLFARYITLKYPPFWLRPSFN